MTVTCKKCGWVYFAVSREHAENSKKRFETYYNSLSRKDQEKYYGYPLKHYNYESCWCGNHYKNFRPTKDEEYPHGSTLSPIIQDFPISTE